MSLTTPSLRAVPTIVTNSFLPSQVTILGSDKALPPLRLPPPKARPLELSDLDHPRLDDDDAGWRNSSILTDGKFWRDERDERLTPRSASMSASGSAGGGGGGGGGGTGGAEASERAEGSDGRIRGGVFHPTA